MTPENFAYWLQGFAELNAEPPTPEQWQAIRDHLALVFEKKTPLRAHINGPLAGVIGPVAPLSPTCAAGKPPNTAVMC